MTSFVHVPVERPFNKFYGVRLPPQVGRELLDRVFYRRWQVSPIADDLTYRFFNGSQHFPYRNITVGSGHKSPLGGCGIRLPPASGGAIRRNRCGR